jgi:hypothetical protein
MKSFPLPEKSLRFQSEPKQKIPLIAGFLMLSDQGSNLDSSDPESDVLPITPSDSFVFWRCKIILFFKLCIRNSKKF